MENVYASDSELLRAEIAAVAARLIAEEGSDYGSAKRKAARQLLGYTKVRGNIMPDNEQIEKEVRIYNALFLGDTQPVRLLHLRTLALELMDVLAQFNPLLTGAVLNGTAGEHSDIYLQLFIDNPKSVEMFLLNRNVNFEVSETPHFKGWSEPVETLSFIWKKEGVHLVLYSFDDLRGTAKVNSKGSQERANRDAVQTLISESGRDEA